jgi:hypothetical protein
MDAYARRREHEARFSLFTSLAIVAATIITVIGSLLAA